MNLQEVIMTSMGEFFDNVSDFIDKMKLEIVDKINESEIPFQIIHTRTLRQSIENLYDIYYQFLINKNEKKLNHFTVGPFNYPNEFTIHINDSNYSIKVTKTTDKILITYLYYIDNILQIPFLGYENKFKMHDSYESLMDDLSDIYDCVINDQITLY